MRRVLLVVCFVFGIGVCALNSYAFFVGFGSTGAAKQVIKDRQAAGKIPKAPGKTTPPGAKTVWQKSWNGGSNDRGQGIAVDSSGNVYVTGGSYNGANWDYLTIKYRQY